MKRLLLVILLLFFCVSMTVDAKLKFGNWDKWDEELPPPDDRSWIWAIDAKSPILGGQRPIEVCDLKGDRILNVSNLYYRGIATKASILFYSLNTIEQEIFIYKIPQPSWAVVVFPPQKKKCVVMVYKIDDKIDESFGKWEEKWSIDFSNYQTVIPKGSKLRDWLNGVVKGTTIGDLAEDKIVESLLPKLVLIDRDRDFTLLIGTPEEIKQIEGIIKFVK